MEVREFFDELVGQDKAKVILSRGLATDKLAQTLIFVGPRGVGKRTAATVLARAIHGSDQTVHPDTFNFADILEEKREQNVSSPIKAAVDEMIKYLQMSPMASTRKVAILPRVEELSIEAQNALLKTLEEPRPDTVLILTAESIEQVLPTIVSRAQLVRFGPIDDSQIFERLPGIDPEIVHSANGSLEFAIKMQSDSSAWEEFRQISEFWANIGRKDIEAKFGWADKMKDREEAARFLETGLMVLRRMWLERADITMAESIVQLQTTLNQVRANVNPKTALEALMLVF